MNQAAGVTLFLSSHLLSEIEKLVTHIGVINKGELIFQKAIEDANKMNRNQNVIRIKTDNNAKATQLFQKMYSVAQNSHNALEVPFENNVQIFHIS